MKKRVVSLLLACVMLLGLLPAAALASSGENPTPPAAATSAKVNFTAQAAGAFLCAPQFDVEVSSQEAENFGYTDSVTDGVSALDVLVKAHEVIYGENFTTNKKADYLEVGSSGFVSKLFGLTTDASGFTLNGAYPNDGTPADYGGYNGTTVTTQAVVDNDNLEFFAYQDDKTHSDQLAWFSQNGLAVDTVTAKPSATVELVLKSNMYMMGYLYENADAMHAAGSAVEGAQLAWVNTATGKVTAIENAVTDETGKVNLTMPSTEGTTYLTAYMPAANIEDGKSPLILSLTKVVADNNTVESDSCTLSSLVLMDELGFLENDALAFQEAVLRGLDGDAPVLAAIKPKDTEFLCRVREHPKAEVFWIDEQNRDALYASLLPRITAWNAKIK